MKCLVLGGNGFIGSHLTKELVRQGHEVTIYGHKNTVFNLQFIHDRSIAYIEGDFLDHKLLSKSLNDIDVVFHLISTTIPSTSNENPHYDAESNILGTLELLDSIRQSNVKKTIFISSGGTIYGIPQYTPIDEEHPNNPACAYGISKLAIEKYFALYKKLHQIDYTILRVSNPFGEFQNPLAYQGVIAVFIYKVLTGQPINIWGDGEIVRDYIYIKDVARASVKAMNYSGDESTFNIASGKGISLNEIIRQIATISNSSPEVIYTDARKFDVPLNILDIEKANKYLQWQPEVYFKDAIHNTFVWYQSLISDKPDFLNRL